MRIEKQIGILKPSAALFFAVFASSCEPKVLNPVGFEEDTGDSDVGICGDGVIDSDLGETCDDGDVKSFDGCSAACRREDSEAGFCGNGIFETELEEDCDDGNNQDGDGCSSRCLVECGYSCASGSTCAFNCDILKSQVEDSDCEGPLDELSCCGDGIVQEDLGELCDDGNLVNDDECTNLCGVII